MSALSPLEFHAPPEEELEALLPEFDQIQFIAKGGMGAVYRARQKSLERIVAIKLLPRRLSANLEFRAHFEHEARAMARLKHRNLLHIYDFGEVNGLLYLVIEYAPKGSLHEYCHGRALSQEEAVGLILGILNGLASAHENGLLHRDIKPANILLDAELNPKLADFGLAAPVIMEAGARSRLNLGTPGYTAPEVFNAPDEGDARVDVFSVGVIFYELLAGILPSEPYVTPSEITSCPEEFDTIVEAAINKNPAMRYANASVMARDIKRVLERDEAKKAKKRARLYRIPGEGVKRLIRYGIIVASVLVIGVVLVLQKRENDLQKELAGREGSAFPASMRYVRPPAEMPRLPEPEELAPALQPSVSFVAPPVEVSPLVEKEVLPKESPLTKVEATVEKEEPKPRVTSRPVKEVEVAPREDENKDLTQNYPKIIALREKLRVATRKAFADARKSRAAEVKRYRWELKVWLTRRKNDEEKTFSRPLALRASKFADKNFVLTDKPSLAGLPPDLVAIYQKYYKKQKKLDGGLSRRFNNYIIAYHGRLVGLREEYDSIGEETGVKAVLQELERIGGNSLEVSKRLAEGNFIQE